MTGKLRVGIIVTQLEAGGAQKLAIWQGEVLKPEFEVDLIFLYFKSDFMGLTQKNCLSLSGRRTALNLLKIFFLLSKKLRDKDSVLAHTHFAILMALLIKAFVHPKLKIVAVHHSEQSLYGATLSRVLNSRLAQKLISKNVFVAKHIAREPNFLVIPNPITSKASPSIMVEVERGTDILFVGRLSKEKRLEDLLHALAKVQNLNLIVLGNGAQMEHLVRLTQILKIADRVSFLGLKTPAQVEKYLSQCSKIVIPSESEALPMVLLESLAAGCNILCSKIPAHTFALDAGLAQGFAVGDVAELASLLDAPADRINTDLVRSQILQAFDPAIVQNSWIGLLNNIEPLRARAK